MTSNPDVLPIPLHPPPEHSSIWAPRRCLAILLLPSLTSSQPANCNPDRQCCPTTLFHLLRRTLIHHNEVAKSEKPYDCLPFPANLLRQTCTSHFCMIQYYAHLLSYGFCHIRCMVLHENTHIKTGQI